jgi:hypothetical protein
MSFLLEVVYRSADAVSAVYKQQLHKRQVVSGKSNACDCILQVEFKGKNAEQKSRVS